MKQNRFKNKDLIVIFLIFIILLVIQIFSNQKNNLRTNIDINENYKSLIGKSIKKICTEVDGIILCNSFNNENIIREVFIKENEYLLITITKSKYIKDKDNGK